MKKQISVCIFIFSMFVFHLSIPNVVFGESLVDLGLDEYSKTFQHPDIYQFFPDFLRTLQMPVSQELLLNSTVIRTFIKDPRLVWGFDLEADPSIVGLLATDDGFRSLFDDEDFHAVLMNPDAIGKLVVAIEGLEPEPDEDDCVIPPPPPPKATTLSIVSGYGQEGLIGARLQSPFIVEVRDQYGKPFSGANVVFHVTNNGGGSLSSTMATTNSLGQAQTTLTLGSSAGTNSVRVNVTDIPEVQTFFTATVIAPGVSAQLPSVYWIEGGTLYYQPTGGGKMMFHQPQGGTLTGGLAVDMVRGRVYWTEKTKTQMGRIRSANLNGMDIRKVDLGETDGVPLGVAVNTNGDSVYWTTSLGKIQRINVGNSNSNTESITDVRTNLNSPKTHIAFDEDGGLYWTELGGIKKWKKMGLIVKVSGEKLGGIAVAGGRVYWTEQTGGYTPGAVKWKNINGSGGQGKFLGRLTQDVPKGIAVDAEGGRIYWTTSLGEIRSAPVPEDGETVVMRRDDSDSASGIALGNGASIPLSPVAPSISLVGSQENTLLANYPNPFNPETWIPYQLSEPTEVTVSIYSVNGSLIRTLALGHQSAGVYQSKSRAAYWDGRNAFGERVASGLYFYTLTAGDFTATRKMLIRK